MGAFLSTEIAVVDAANIILSVIVVVVVCLFVCCVVVFANYAHFYIHCIARSSS